MQLRRLMPSNSQFFLEKSKRICTCYFEFVTKVYLFDENRKLCNIWKVSIWVRVLKSNLKADRLTKCDQLFVLMAGCYWLAHFKAPKLMQEHFNKQFKWNGTTYELHQIRKHVAQFECNVSKVRGIRLPIYLFICFFFVANIQNALQIRERKVVSSCHLLAPFMLTIHE